MNEEIKAAHQRFDARLTELLAEAKRQGLEAPCKAGCSACCSEPMYAEKREAERIAERVRNFPKEERERVHQATREWVLKFTSSPLFHQTEPHVIPYRRLRLPCPLLKDNLCTVYADRPFGCRAHIAKADATLCQDDALRPRQQFLVTAANLIPESMMPLYLHGTEHDHLALLLHQEFFGGGPSSAACLKLEVVP